MAQSNTTTIEESPTQPQLKVVDTAVQPMRAPSFEIQSNVNAIRYLKALVYGDYGSGKTFLMGTAVEVPQMRDVLLLSAEAGELTLYEPDAKGDSPARFFPLIDIVGVQDYKTTGRVYDFLKLHCSIRQQAEDGDKEARDKLFGLQQRLMPRIPDPNRLRLYKTVIIDSLGEVENMCIAEGTWVWDPSGLICKIQNHPNTISKGLKETITIHTHRGFEVTCTPDHRILTSYGWKAANELTLGDILEYQTNFNIKSAEEAPNTDYWWIIGFWLGDGSNFRENTKSYISFAPGIGPDRTFLIEELTRVLGEEQQKWGDQENGHITFTHQKHIVEHIRALFEMEKGSPKNLFCPLDKINNVSAFLRGLFDADGCVIFAKGGTAKLVAHLNLSSKSLDLLKDVQVALSAYGIYGTIGTNNSAKNVSYFLNMSDVKSLQIFQKYINFSIPAKKNKLAEGLEGRVSNYQTAPRVTFIEKGPDCLVYDLLDQPDERFSANGLVVHNCMSQLLGVDAATLIDEELNPESWDEYRKQRQMIHRLIRGFRNLPMNSLFTCPRNFREVQEGTAKRQKYIPMMTGKLSNEVQGFMDMVAHLVVGNLTESEAAEGEVPDAILPRRMYIQPGPRHAAKSRFTIFKKAYWDNPTMLRIMTDVGLLEKEQKSQPNPPSEKKGTDC